MDKKTAFFLRKVLQIQKKCLPLHPQSRNKRKFGISEAKDTGKSHTASSLRILQGLIAAKVVGCSGAIWSAYPPASLAQLARARDL